MTEQPQRGAKVRRLEIEVGGYKEPFKFTVALSDYQQFQREAMTNAAGAIDNLLLRTCTSPGRDALLGLFEEHWGLPAVLSEAIMKELVDLRSTHLKNSGGA